MTSTYSRACTEALAIIDCLADEEYNKIPIEKLRFLEDNCDPSYLFKIDSDVELAEQNVMDETYAILLAIYRDDFATENQRKILNTLLIQNFNEKEEEKKEKYTKYQELHGEVHKAEKSVPEVALVSVEKKWYTKVFEFVKRMFGK